MNYVKGETIAALATPPGDGGIAVIRISGSEALAVGNAIFSGDVKSYKTHTAHFGNVINRDGEKVDEALILVMHGNRSYTGEDTVEIQCHGGSLISRKVLETALAAGARAALPGEFTFKAFMNGKLDLAQAEGVQALIGAKNSSACRAADAQLSGHLSKYVEGFQKELFDIAAILEAWVDYPEEGLEFASTEDVITKLEDVRISMQKLADTFHDGRRIHEGIQLCLAGAPNAGKSSLMNALLGSERAIVTNVAGTTRDLLEEDLHIGGLNFRLTDTAGLRETQEQIEREGIKRAYDAMKRADLVLYVIDASENVELPEELPLDKTVVVWNKMDLPESKAPLIDHPYCVEISAKNNLGIDALKQAINDRLWTEGMPDKDQVMITHLRHHEALISSIEAMHPMIDGLKSGISAEFVASDMREALKQLSVIIGKDVSEEILSSIFSKFCVGK